MIINCNGKPLDLTRPQVMGILNVTPDSFSDGGKYFSIEHACEHARQMVEQGAAIIDVGGESTRPGATPVSTQEEIDRVVPIISILSRELPVPISIDTSKPEVMRTAIQAGAGLVNDVRALMLPGALTEMVLHPKVAICLMHIQGEPQTMQQQPEYQDVVTEVKDFLANRITACLAAGVSKQRLLIDPGFGFGKTLIHNLQLLKNLAYLSELQLPIMVGLSRKTMIDHLLGLPVSERLPASLALAVMAVMQGAKLVRVHDVKATVEAVAMVNAVQQDRCAHNGCD